MASDAGNRLKSIIEAQQQIESAQNFIAEATKDDLEPPEFIDMTATTDLKNAYLFVRLHKNNVRYVSEWECWVVWNGKYWQRQAQGNDKHIAMIPYVEKVIMEIKDMARRLAGERDQDKMMKHAQNTESLARMIACVKTASGFPVLIAHPEDFDTNIWLFNVQNGTLNMKNQQLHEFRQKDYITRISPATWRPDAKSKLYLTVLERIQPDSEIQAYLQNLAGQCLTGEVREKAFWIFWGAGGDNGKSTLIETWKYILGSLSQTIPIQSLLKDNKGNIPADLHSLIGARMADASEPDIGDELTPGMIKRITGRDTMKTRTLHELPQQWTVQFNLIIATNHDIKIRDPTDAMWGRVKRIPFLQKIPKNEIDDQLKYKLREDFEMSGILNWMIEGCARWLKEGMKEPASITASVQEFRAESDKLTDFFEYFFEKQYDAFMPFNILYPIYKLWCDCHQIRPVQEQTLPQLFAERGYPREKVTYTNLQGQKCRGRGNMGFKFQEYWIKKDNSLNKVSRTELYDSLKTISNPVHEILMAIDSDYEHAKWLCGQRDRVNQVDATGLVSCTSVENTMSTLSTLSNREQENDPTILSISTTSVHPVPSVLEEIVRIIQKNYNKYPKPDSIIELKDLKRSMKDFVEVELDKSLPEGAELPEKTLLEKIIDDWCRARQWE